MRGDEDVGHFLPVLRRIIILVAVITAIPVVLWTITAFVRTYVSPPRIPTFHQLAATASIDPASRGSKENGGSPPLASGGNAAPSSGMVEPSAAAPDLRDAAASPKGPFLGEPPPAASPPATRPSAADTAAAMPAAGGAQMPGPAGPMKPADMSAPPTAAVPDSAPAAMAVALPQPAAAEPSADATPASAPALPAAEALAGPIPLPRPRPHAVAGAPAAGDTTHIASAGGPIPMPRPRPEAAGPAATAEDSGSGPLGFIQNLFGGSK